MIIETTTFVLSTLVLLLAGLVLRMYTTRLQLRNEFDNYIKEQASVIEAERKEAVRRSKSVTRGQVSEQVIPIMEGFPYDLGEMKFMGQPFDYVLFQNMNKFRDGDKDVEINVIFTDVKTESAKRTPVQNAIRKAILEGRVRYEDWKIIDNKLSIK